VAHPLSAKAPAAEPAGPGNLLAGAAVLGATVASYLPALRAGFIWNDSDYVTAPALRSLEGLKRIWFEVGATEQYYPLLHSVFWLQQRLFGDSPAGYHVVNLLFHLASVILFAMVLRKLLADRFPAGEATAAAWLGAGLFALHPVHVASVAWITEQKNTFSLVFYLAAALAYLRFDESRRPRHYAAALGLFCIAMLGKTSTVTLPAALLVVLWWRRGRLEWRRDWRPLLPWLLLGASAGVFSSWVERNHLGGAGVGATGAEFELTPAGHVLLASRAIWFYLGSLVWPFNLNFVYPRWEIDGTVWWQWMFPLATLGAAGWFWAWRQRDRSPLAVFLLFAGTLFPVLGFVNLYGAHFAWVWDHWQYLADLAPLALAGAVLVRTGARFGPRHRHAGAALGVLLCIFLGALTWRRCGDFHDNETLYRRTLARNPDCWLAQGNLALILAQNPEGWPEALTLLNTALKAHPDNEELHLQLGTILARMPGRQAEAIAAYEQALQIRPAFPNAHLALGTALMDFPDRRAEAVRHFEAAVRLKPDSVPAHYMLARALSAFPDRLSEAIAAYEATLRLDPRLAEAHTNLAIILAGVPGQTGNAIAHFEAAAKLNPGSASAHYNLGGALMSVPGRSGEALREFEQALRLDPRHPGARMWVERLRGAAP
jgi:tetratricopeptide (TPR) repeat protein